MLSKNTITPMAVYRVQVYSYTANGSYRLISSKVSVKDIIRIHLLCYIAGILNDIIKNTTLVSSGREVIVSKVGCIIIDKFSLVTT